MFTFYCNEIISIISNIIGGIIVAILIPVYLVMKRWHRNWQLKKILGRDADSSSMFNIVYAKLSLPDFYDRSTKEIVKYPYYKEAFEGHQIKSKFSIKYPVSSCENRAVSYISSFYASYIKKDINIVSDIDIFSKFDLSYISLGWDSNYKTIDAIKNKSNTLVYIGDDHNFRSIKTNEIIFVKEEGYDYGLILKIHPYEYPKRVWMVCAGIGEYGTSGAAWFLSHKWKEFFKKSDVINNPLSRFKSKNFFAIIRVTPGKDESAILAKLIADESKFPNYLKQNKGDVKIIHMGTEVVAPSPSGSPYGFVVTKSNENDMESSGHTISQNLKSEPTSSIDKKIDQ